MWRILSKGAKSFKETTNVLNSIVFFCKLRYNIKKLKGVRVLANLKEKEFMSLLKEGSVPSLCLLYGADEYSKEICHRRYLKSIKTEDKPTSLDGGSLDISVFQNEVCSASFFSEDKMISVRNPNIENMSQGDLDSLYSILKQKPNSTYLVFIVKAQNINVKKSSKWAKFIKTISDNGVVVECLEKNENDAVSMIMSYVKKNGCTIDKELARNLAERSLNDMLIVEGNLVKLCAFAAEKSNGIITVDAIDNLTSRQLDFKAYEIAKQILKRNISSATEILNSLFLQQIDAISINSALSSSFLDIYRVKTMQQYNHPTSALNDFSEYKGKGYRITGAGYDANKCSLEFLKTALLYLSQTDILLKSTKDDKKILMEKTLFKIFSIDANGNRL